MEFSSTELHLNISIRSVARAFHIADRPVKRSLLRGYEDLPERGRHRELSPEDEHALVEWIAKKAHNNTAVTRTELLNYCIATFGTAVTRGWVNSFLSRPAAELFETKVPLKKIKDLKSLESSLKLRLKAYEPMYRMHVEILSLISTKLEFRMGGSG
jgi:transposase